ncbi:hypothetical protein AVEN_263723-1 [Araneus ventricosus]|uniref:Uncharacterized protein n=1 Tax=Araneus ventricosus TaxID=182803 RepID=A0A4Y2ATR6_ARAVE|nr:hypothetical protein AVEN_263723-1 [Araneus ventricosus]
MSFLKQARKEDLISLATDNPDPTFSKVDSVGLIQRNKHYNEEDAKLMLETVVAEREERFKLQAEQKETEQERLKMEAEKERLMMEIELEKSQTTSDGSTNPKHEKRSC